MKWLIIIPGTLILVILAMLILGLFQPVKHSITRSIHLKQKPEAVFAVVENIDDLPNSSTTVLKVERLPDHDGKPVARVTLKWGHMQMIMTQLERTPPVRLANSMAKEGGSPLGIWKYELAAESDGCRVALTEEGEMTNPFYRAIGRIRGLDTNVKQSLHDLAKKFGESVEVR
jgi:hypothetical protein